MPVNITEEFVRYLMEQNASLSGQVAELTATVDSMNQTITELNQTIRELKEQLNKNSKNRALRRVMTAFIFPSFPSRIT